MSKTKQGFALKTFNDAGTEQSFEGGKVHDFEAGAYDNYLAAGLIRAPEKAEQGATPPNKPAS